MPVRAAVLRRHAEPPSVEPCDVPVAADGEVLIDVAAAPITPLDVLCASGTSYFGAPPLPYVPGVQGVGAVRSGSRPEPGTRVWFSTRAGMQPGDGSMRTVCVVPEADVVALTHDVEPTLVAALGLSAIAAWMALTWRGELSEGEQVIVLGAGGVVGQVAVQAARLGGARRVVAGCRSVAAARRARDLGADAVVRLDTEDVDELRDRFRAASDGPVELVLDPVFGAPAAAALRALAPYGRLVNLGDAADATAPIDSATLRSGSLRVLGYTNNELTAQQRTTALLAVLAHAAAGRLTLDYETVSLDDAAKAWTRQAHGSAAKRIVLTLA
ncbi:MAG: quinone oxidoreductase family protein [Streptosporangiales bacterium]